MTHGSDEILRMIKLTQNMTYVTMISYFRFRPLDALHCGASIIKTVRAIDFERLTG